MPKVFVIQPPYRDKDLSSAHRYGTIHFIFDDARFQPSVRPGIARWQIDKALVNFDPTEDYLLFLGGDWVGSMMVGQSLQFKFPGQGIKILRWERERTSEGDRRPGAGFYVPSVIKP
jgi:hypothetical protein